MGELCQRDFLRGAGAGGGTLHRHPVRQWGARRSLSLRGAGGGFGHTFYPAPINGEPIAGDMHFDADESWHAGTNTDLFSVALHETGHALGLGHSSNPVAVMYPYYRMQTGLTSDDIAGIQALYGPAVTTPAVPPVPTPV